VQDLKDFFWEDLQGEVQRAAQGLFQLLSERQRDLYIVSPRYAQDGGRKDCRNGYYGRNL